MSKNTEIEGDTMFIHPSELTTGQRAENNASLQDRMTGAMSRVAADKNQPKRVRDANARDAKTARTMAARMRTNG